jgi:unsaturated rhamnogalacturonyl hydrolase
MDETFGLRMVRSVMSRYTKEQVRWHYEHGLVIQAIYQLGRTRGLPDLCHWAFSMLGSKIRGDGSIDGFVMDEYNLDYINAGRLLFDLRFVTGDPRYLTALETLGAQLKNQPRTASGGFWHKKIYPNQMWLDGLYMAEPFYARYAQTFPGEEARAAAYNDIVHQFSLCFEKTRDRESGLLYHAWDESRRMPWADKTTGCSPHFWGRAMGWYCMALVETLDAIPAAETDARARLLDIARSLIAPVAACQDGQSGLWYQVLDQGAREKNYLESSASAMFAYFFIKLRNHYGDALSPNEAETAGKAGEAGFRGLVTNMLREDPATGELHLDGICSVAGLGGTPYRSGDFAYYVSEPVVSDDFKGVGPFIKAALEYETAYR